MSDWKFLNSQRLQSGEMASTEDDGFNGAFILNLSGTQCAVIAADGMGWKHVSVHLIRTPKVPPPWDIMCRIKELFWEDEDCVIQFHPPKSRYINHHPGTLHLWQKEISPGVGAKVEMPPLWMV